jgi:hypothetical protein
MIPNATRKALKARADEDCPECHGEGLVTYTARNRDGEVEVACFCAFQVVEDDEDDDVQEGMGHDED